MEGLFSRGLARLVLNMPCVSRLFYKQPRHSFIHSLSYPFPPNSLVYKNRLLGQTGVTPVSLKVCISHTPPAPPPFFFFLGQRGGATWLRVEVEGLPRLVNRPGVAGLVLIQSLNHYFPPDLKHTFTLQPYELGN